MEDLVKVGHLKEYVDEERTRQEDYKVVWLEGRVKRQAITEGVGPSGSATSSMVLQTSMARMSSGISDEGPERQRSAQTLEYRPF